MASPRCWHIMSAAAFLVVTALSTPAHADLAKPSDPESLAHFDQGNRHYRVGEFEKAVESYKQSLMIEEASATWFNIAQASRQAGNYEQADWFYRRLLARTQLTGEERDHIQSLIDAMRAEREQAARSKPPLDAAPAESGRGLTTGEPNDEIGAARSRWYEDRLGWGLTGGGVVTSAVGVGVLLNASAVRTSAEREIDVVERERLRKVASKRKTIGLVTTGAGAVLTATGVLTFAIRSRAKADRGQLRPSAEVSFGYQWVGIQGRF